MTTIESTRAAYEAAIRTDERARILATLNGVTNPKLRNVVPVRTGAKGQKRKPRELAALEARLAAHIDSHVGNRIEQIAGHMGVKTKDLALPVKKLLAAKRIKTTGHTRATRYFPRAS